MVRRMTRTRWFQILIGLILFLLLINLAVSTFGVVSAEDTDTYDIGVTIDEDVDEGEATLNINVTNTTGTGDFDVELYFENETVDTANDTAEVSWSYTGKQYAEENYTLTDLEESETYHYNVTVLESSQVVDYQAGSFEFGGSSGLTAYLYGSASTTYDWFVGNWYYVVILLGAIVTLKMYYDKEGW